MIRVWQLQWLRQQCELYQVVSLIRLQEIRRNARVTDTQML